mgnify:CR=1 FL=1
MKKIKFCDLSLLGKSKKNKVFSRSSVILDNHIGKVFNIHNGRDFFSILVNSRMKGHRFGEFCLTRKHFSHKNKKKKK